MSEVNTPRLMAAAKEFNIGKDTLIDFLVSKGFSSDDLKPTAKLTEKMYGVLQSEFLQDKVAKQKAQQIDLPKNAGADAKKKRDEEDLSFKKKEKETVKAKEEPAVEQPRPVEPEAPVAEPPVVNEIQIEEVKVPEPEPKEIPATPAIPEPGAVNIVKIDAPELESPKIIDKINLDAIDSSTRPKKTTKKKKARKTTKNNKK